MSGPQDSGAGRPPSSATFSVGHTPTSISFPSKIKDSNPKRVSFSSKVPGETEQPLKSPSTASTRSRAISDPSISSKARSTTSSMYEAGALPFNPPSHRDAIVALRNRRSRSDPLSTNSLLEAKAQERMSRQDLPPWERRPLHWQSRFHLMG